MATNTPADRPGPLTLPRGGARFVVDRAPDHGSADFQIPPSDIRAVSATFRAGEPASSGSVTLDNDGLEYSDPSSAYALARDDRLVFEYRLAEDGVVGAGEGAAGSGTAGDWHRLGDWLLDKPPAVETEHAHSTVELSLVDYVWGILKMRRAFYGDEGQSIAGNTQGGDGEESHLNRILERHCPEIDRTSIATVPAITDYAAHGLACDRVVADLAAEAAHEVGGLLPFSRGRRLFFEPIERLPRPYAGTEPFGPSDFGGAASSQGEGSVANIVRVDGGTDKENIDDAQETVDRAVPANATNRLAVRVSVRKTRVPAVEVYTRGDSTSEDGLRVRLQASGPQGLGPIDPTNPDSDYVTSPVRKIALDDNGWTRFPLAMGPEHAINTTEAWLIIDSPGASGYDVGVRDNGDGTFTPAYRIHFEKPIVAVRPDPSSLGRHLPHEMHVQDDGLATRQAVRARADRELETNARSDRILAPGEAMSDRAHRLRVGDLVRVHWPAHRAVGEFAVTERKITFHDFRLDTELELTGSGALS